MVRACTESWDLRAHTPSKIGDWLMLDDNATTTTPEKVFHLTKVEDGHLRGRIYSKGKGSQLLRIEKGDDTILQTKLTAARVVRKAPTGQVTDFNPKNISIFDSLWLFGKEKVKNLEFDPKEWCWRKQGSL
jgi:hypothetical protein